MTDTTSQHKTEAERLLKLCAGDALKAFDIVEKQLSVLVLRTQVLLSLSGIVITVTGFSGRAIADTNSVARACISSGIVVVLLSAVVAIMGVLRLRWLTQAVTEEPLQTIENGIQIRERKSRFLSTALILFVSGFSLYCIAIAQLLLAAKPTH